MDSRSVDCKERRRRYSQLFSTAIVAQDQRLTTTASLATTCEQSCLTNTGSERLPQAFEYQFHHDYEHFLFSRMHKLFNTKEFLNEFLKINSTSGISYRN